MKDKKKVGFVDEVTDEVKGFGDEALQKLAVAQAHKYAVLADPEKQLAIREFWLLVFAALSVGFWVAVYYSEAVWVVLFAALFSMNWLVLLAQYWSARKEFLRSGGKL